jgi:hypothetical protein
MHSEPAAGFLWLHRSPTAPTAERKAAPHVSLGKQSHFRQTPGAAMMSLVVILDNITKSISLLGRILDIIKTNNRATDTSELLFTFTAQNCIRIGRERESKALKRHIRNSRNIIITGPAGIGKTNLYYSVLSKMKHEIKLKFPGGVFYCDLYSNPTLLQYRRDLEEKIRLYDGLKEAEPIQNILGRRRRLIILEGAENFRNIHDILSINSSAKYIVTSRDDLHVEEMRLLFGEVQHIKLGRPEHSICINILKQFATNDEYRKGHHTDYLSQVVTILDHLPLALFITARNRLFNSKIDEFVTSIQQDSYRAIRQGNRKDSIISTDILGKILMRSVGISIDGKHDIISRDARILLGLLGSLAYGKSVLSLNMLVLQCLDTEALAAELSDKHLILIDGDTVIPTHALLHQCLSENSMLLMGTLDPLEKFLAFLLFYHRKDDEERTRFGGNKALGVMINHIASGLSSFSRHYTGASEYCGALLAFGCNALFEYGQFEKLSEVLHIVDKNDSIQQSITPTDQLILCAVRAGMHSMQGETDKTTQAIQFYCDIFEGIMAIDTDENEDITSLLNLLEIHTRALRHENALEFIAKYHNAINQFFEKSKHALEKLIHSLRGLDIEELVRANKLDALFDSDNISKTLLIRLIDLMSIMLEADAFSGSKKSDISQAISLYHVSTIITGENSRHTLDLMISTAIYSYSIECWDVCQKAISICIAILNKHYANNNIKWLEFLIKLSHISIKAKHFKQALIPCQTAYSISLNQFGSKHPMSVHLKRKLDSLESAINLNTDSQEPLIYEISLLSNKKPTFRPLAFIIK